MLIKKEHRFRCPVNGIKLLAKTKDSFKIQLFFAILTTLFNISTCRMDNPNFGNQFGFSC